MKGKQERFDPGMKEDSLPLRKATKGGPWRSESCPFSSELEHPPLCSHPDGAGTPTYREQVSL